MSLVIITATVITFIYLAISEDNYIKKNLRPCSPPCMLLSLKKFILPGSFKDSPHPKQLDQFYSLNILSNKNNSNGTNHIIVQVSFNRKLQNKIIVAEKRNMENTCFPKAFFVIFHRFLPLALTVVYCRLLQSRSHYS